MRRSNIGCWKIHMQCNNQMQIICIFCSVSKEKSQKCKNDKTYLKRKENVQLKQTTYLMNLL